MTISPAKKSQTAALPESPNLQEDIRRRAYELYEARDREDGHELDDWLRAEEEIRNQETRAVAA